MPAVNEPIGRHGTPRTGPNVTKHITIKKAPKLGNGELVYLVRNEVDIRSATSMTPRPLVWTLRMKSSRSTSLSRLYNPMDRVYHTNSQRVAARQDRLLAVMAQPVTAVIPRLQRTDKLWHMTACYAERHTQQMLLLVALDLSRSAHPTSASTKRRWCSLQSLEVPSDQSHPFWTRLGDIGVPHTPAPQLHPSSYGRVSFRNNQSIVGGCI